MSDPQNPNDPYSQANTPPEGQPWGQQPAGQYGQPAGGQYDQPGGGQYDQPGQYGQPTGGQYGQPAGGQYAQQQWSGGQPQQSGMGSTDGKGFFAALFDFNFTSFVTPKIIKIVYLVVTAVIAASLLFFIIAALLTGEALAIIGALIIGPLVALVYLALSRMTLELYYAVIRLSEDVHERLPRQ